MLLSKINACCLANYEGSGIFLITTFQRGCVLLLKKKRSAAFRNVVIENELLLEKFPIVWIVDGYYLVYKYKLRMSFKY